MLNFYQYCQIAERKVDPVKLAQRVSRRYGTRTSFSKWEKVPKGGHIPLSSFDEKLSGDAAEALYDFQERLGMEDRDKKVRDAAERKYQSMHRKVDVDIDRLVATQPYVLTQDVERLRSKIANVNPDHIRVVKHNGKYFVDDGHHAVVAAQLRGEKRIKVNMIDLD